MSQADSAPLVEYHGNCHCGAFKFTFKAPQIKDFANCDCSICSKNGYMWLALPIGNPFDVVKGDEKTTLATYEFGKRSLEHKFCPTCGTSIFARLKDPNNSYGMNVLINIRVVQDVDFPSLTVKTTYKGSALGDPYQVPAPVPAKSPLEGATEYNASCRCGAVAYTLLTPEKLTSATECNCSICYRDGALWTYHPMTNITFRGLESVTEYAFGKGTTLHGFCKVCGVAIYERYTGLEEDGKDAAWRGALNVRLINNLDLSTIKLEPLDGQAYGSPYVVPA